MGFFDPTPQFLTWLIERAGERLIIDAGAGDCHLADALAERGHPVLAVEPWPDPDLAFGRSYLLPLAIHQVSLVKTTPALIVCARPDHSGWCGEIPGYMHPDSEMLYLGLDLNTVRDLEGLRFEKLDVKKPRGIEIVASLKPQPASMTYQSMFSGIM